MPPPQRLATGLRGFVCKSCSSKLPRGRWLSRNLSSDQRPRESKGATSNPKLRFYEQYPDGTRTDITQIEDLDNTPEQDALGVAMMERIEELESHTGKSIEELLDGPGIDLEAGESVDKNSGLIPSMAEVESEFPTNDKPSQTLQAILDRIEEGPALESLSPEEREKLQADIAEILKNDAPEPELEPSRTANTPAPSLPKRSPRSNDFNTQAPVSEKSSSRYNLSFHDFPKKYQDHIYNLQKALEDHQRPPRSSRSLKHKPKLRDHKFPSLNRAKTLGKAYALARKGLLSTPSKVPPTIWHTLWTVLGPEGMAHIKRIGEDMDEIGAPMLPSQRLLYIEALFMEGLQKAAVENWEKSKHLAEVVSSEYWELGLRMFSRVGQLDQATKAAEMLFQSANDSRRYRSLVSLIDVYLTSETDLSVQRAWAFYIRLKANLGTEMTMEDYDAVISSFMKAGQPELGLAAFRDMMLSGDASGGRHDSISIQRAKTGLINLSNLNIQSNELDWKDSKTLSLLPARFKNKFFFGSWVKKLIGEGDFEAARQVLDLMQDHRIQPSPMHMNGLIGAWFREGTEKSWLQADELAWKMIRRRVEIVEGQERKDEIRRNFQAPLSPEFSKNKHSFQRPDYFPPATAETFTMLIREYRQRQKSEAMSDLFDAWRKSKSPTTTRLMNQLLLMDLRGRHKNWAWETYSTLNERQQVKPNTETFSILWDLEKRNCDPTIGGAVPDKGEHFARRKFPTPRHLFSEMMKHKSILVAEGRMSRDLYDLIMLCFSFKQDQAGTAVALRALHRHFNMYPNDDTARIIVNQLSRLGLMNEAGIEPRRLNLNQRATQNRIASVATLVQKFRDQRIQTLLENGTVFDELSEEEKLEETLVIFSDILRFAAESKLSAQETNTSVANESKKAAYQMGVPDCVTWDSNV